MEREPADDLSDEELADLAQLADGTLDAARRPEVEARVAASPALAAVVERQGAALDALRATADVGAPARLRAEVERARGGRRAGAGRARRPLFAGAIAAAAVVIIAVAVVLPGLSSDDPSFEDAVALGAQPPAQPAPPVDSGTPQLLNASVDDVAFPNYAAKFGWKAAGAREDDPSGRGAKTVFYEKDGRRIAYTIVSGDALDPPGDARSEERGGVTYRTFRDDGRNVVTWERGGQTCVLSGAEVESAELVGLADWRGKGAIAF